MERVKKPKNKPNFLAVGVPKAGTSSLYSYLKEHPEVYLPEQKELHFFTNKTLQENTEGPGDKLALNTVIKKEEDYMALYNGLKNQTVSGDISPSYFFFADQAIPAIKENLGDDIKIIITLRDPIGRAFSNYLHQKRLLHEELTFDQAILNEEKRKKDGFGDFWRYKEQSLYYEKCIKYIEAFGKENVKIILFEDLIQNTEKEVKDIYTFLKVDNTFKPSNINEVFNKGGVYKKSKLTSFLLKPSRLKQFVLKIIGDRFINKYRAYKSNVLEKNTEVKPIIEKQTIQTLKLYFKEDIEMLKTLNIDTTKWKYFN